MLAVDAFPGGHFMMNNLFDIHTYTFTVADQTACGTGQVSPPQAVTVQP